MLQQVVPRRWRMQQNQYGRYASVKSMKHVGRAYGASKARRKRACDAPKARLWRAEGARMLQTRVKFVLFAVACVRQHAGRWLQVAENAAASAIGADGVLYACWEAVGDLARDTLPMQYCSRWRPNCAKLSPRTT